ncbi:ABC transporter, putative, partial [Talaromyces stipitatus ATCC 10500]
MLVLPALRSRKFPISIPRQFLRHATTTPKIKKYQQKTNLHKLYQLKWRPLISIKEGTFYRDYPVSSDASGQENHPLLNKIDFTLPSRPPQWPELPPPTCGKRAKERYERELRQEQSIQEEEGPFHWAVIGSDSTEFFNVLQGRYIAVPPRSRQYPHLISRKFTPKDPRKRSPSNAIAYVGFSGEGSQATGGTRGAYLSARYESLREDTDWTVRQYLTGQTELNPLEDENAGENLDQAQLEQVIKDFRLQELLALPMSSLSNGQTRRTRIAKALLSTPELLLLDEPFMGLDPATTESISSLLRNLAYRCSPRVMISLRPQDAIPDWITHVLILDNRRIAFSGPKKDFYKQATKACGISTSEASKARTPLRWLFAPGGLFELQRYKFADDKKTKVIQYSKSNVGVADPTALTQISQHGKPVIEMEGVHVQYGEKVVLGNWMQIVRGRKRNKMGLWWRVRQGQRWAILGANGSGKTTLLSVITSDHPQAYAQPVRLFGRSRLPEQGVPGISIFDLQARMGHSSPEIHAFFPRQLSVRASIESAWADTFLSKPVLTYERDTLVDAVLEYFKPELDPSAEDVKGAKSATHSEEGIDMSFIPKTFRENLTDATAVDNRSTSTPVYHPKHNIDYADNVTFGQLSVAQQRLVLFIRAIIKKQELIILDEAFSGMPANMREKCFYLLNNSGLPTAEQDPELASLPLPYLGPEQALIVVSHLPEEIPDTVRFWMRLPSEVGDGQKLEFAQGVLPDDSTLSSDRKAWDTIWSENSLSKAMFLYGKDNEGELTDGKRYRYVIPRKSRSKRKSTAMNNDSNESEELEEEEEEDEEVYEDEDEIEDAEEEAESDKMRT